MRPALRKPGRAFSLEGQIAYPFEVAGLRFGRKRSPMGLGATCLAQGGSHFGVILGHGFGHDLALGVRSQRISGISLHRITLCISLDGSGLRIEVRQGCFLLPSWANGCQVGKVGEWSKKVKQNEHKIFHIMH